MHLSLCTDTKQVKRHRQTISAPAGKGGFCLLFYTILLVILLFSFPFVLKILDLTLIQSLKLKKALVEVLNSKTIFQLKKFHTFTKSH